MKLHKTPIFRMYNLKVDPDNLKEFEEAGENNFFTSYKKESGTLAMYASHDEKDASKNVVFELYKDDKHYQKHADSDQFKAYGQVAQKVVTGKELHELSPEFIETQSGSNKVSGDNDFHIRLEQFSLKNIDEADFKKKIVDEISTQMGFHTETISTYLARIERDSENFWLLMEVFKDRPALDEFHLNLKRIFPEVIEHDEIDILKVDSMIRHRALHFEN